MLSDDMHQQLRVNLDLEFSQTSRTKLHPYTIAVGSEGVFEG